MQFKPIPGFLRAVQGNWAHSGQSGAVQGYQRLLGPVQGNLDSYRGIQVVQSCPELSGVVRSCPELTGPIVANTDEQGLTLVDRGQQLTHKVVFYLI